jgi:hypothetical protein
VNTVALRDLLLVSLSYTRPAVLVTHFSMSVTNNRLYIKQVQKKREQEVYKHENKRILNMFIRRVQQMSATVNNQTKPVFVRNFSTRHIPLPHAAEIIFLSNLLAASRRRNTRYKFNVRVYVERIRVIPVVLATIYKNTEAPTVCTTELFIKYCGQQLFRPNEIPLGIPL